MSQFGYIGSSSFTPQRVECANAQQQRRTQGGLRKENPYFVLTGCMRYLALSQLSEVCHLTLVLKRRRRMTDLES